jgi:dTDP-L-rhamnose 4-epimerase
MRILVTGGAGFIGSHVVEEFLRQGHEVRILDALLPHAHNGSPPEVPAGVEFRRGNLRDAGTVASALQGIDVVSHQAAMVGRGREILDAPQFAENNDLATAVLLAQMTHHGVSSLVLGSSVVLYGEARYSCPDHGRIFPGPRAVADLDAGRFDPLCPECGAPLVPTALDETDHPDPRNVYAATKLGQELLVQAWARETGGKAVVLRYHNVYGPRMPHDSSYSGVASAFLLAVRQGVAPEVFEDGRPTRDFVHVRDIANANAVALLADVKGFRAFNVATGKPRTIGQMAHALAAATAGPAPIVSGRYRLGDVRHIFASPMRIMRELGWSPSVDFEEGVRELAKSPRSDAPTPS